MKYHIDFARLRQVEARLLWLSHWMIHHANHLRQNDDDIKVGGHQASSASMVSILTALYFAALRPEDRVAVKPHASPIFHAMQYLMGNLNLELLKNFRGYGGAQSYPSRTKDADDVDFSTGSVGLGVAMTSFASLIQDYVSTKQWGSNVKLGRMVALMGDAELDEGNIYECLQEGWKHNLRNTWWVIDYNRQSLDGIIHEGLWEHAEKIFTAYGWDVIRLKYGVLQRAAFDEPGGKKLKDWIDDCPNQDYAALTYMGGKVWRERLLNDLGDQGDFTEFLDRRSDDELGCLMENLGGNCVETMAKEFAEINHNRPVCFLAYTIKGWGTPIAGHKDNHGGLMTPNQMQKWQSSMGIRGGREWDRLEAVADKAGFQRWLDQVPFFQSKNRRFDDVIFRVPSLALDKSKSASTQASFGKILDTIARGDDEIAERIVTLSPDVSGTTSLGSWINRKKLFSRQPIRDAFKDAKIPSTAKWEFDPSGQHIELGIAEMNLFLALAAAGLSSSLFGKRLLPIGTVYDPFVCRGLDALNYACYQDSRFMIIGTPSGVTLAPEGGAHQSIVTPLIGMGQDGLASFEPAFTDELSVIMEWGFSHMQLDDGGSVYLRLSTKPVEQPQREMFPELATDIIKGAYWLRKPGPNCELVIAYQGVIAQEAILAAGHLGEFRRDIGVLAITSADRIYAEFKTQSHNLNKTSHIETLLADVSNYAKILTVIDGHPATLTWLGGVRGNPTISHGVDHFGQTGQINDLYKHFAIDHESLVRSALQQAPRHQNPRQMSVAQHNAA
ncbi:transketolase [Alphaproteobacteria bacterium]|nr:transketolase [Alphaproteobacteria bacterium]MDB0013827.1 transketolase [Alphaproteobacteria bacterium]